MEPRESFRDVENLRFRFQMNNRLRLECLAAVSKVFRDFEEPISDDLLAGLVFALPQELVSANGNGHAYARTYEEGVPPESPLQPAIPPDAPEPEQLPGIPPDTPKPAPKPAVPPDSPKPGPKPAIPPDSPKPGPKPGIPPGAPKPGQKPAIPPNEPKPWKSPGEIAE